MEEQSFVSKILDEASCVLFDIIGTRSLIQGDIFSVLVCILLECWWQLWFEMSLILTHSQEVNTRQESSLLRGGYTVLATRGPCLWIIPDRGKSHSPVTWKWAFCSFRSSSLSLATFKHLPILQKRLCYQAACDKTSDLIGRNLSQLPHSLAIPMTPLSSFPKTTLNLLGATCDKSKRCER